MAASGSASWNMRSGAGKDTLIAAARANMPPPVGRDVVTIDNSGRLEVAVDRFFGLIRDGFA